MSRLDRVRQRYESDGKELARRIAVAEAVESRAENILDLWGGGVSARMFRYALPKSVVTSCESDPELYPALRLDAQAHGYAYHLGDFRKATGRYDYIWLDLTSQWCRAAQEAVATASKMLSGPRVLALSLMAARESPEIAADRLFVVPKGAERASGLRVSMLFPYQSGVPMWFLVLKPNVRTAWVDQFAYDRLSMARILDERDGSPFDRVQSRINEFGYFGGIPNFAEDPTLSFDVDAYHAWRRGEDVPKSEARLRVVRLSSLTPDQQRAMLAYLEVARTDEAAA